MGSGEGDHVVAAAVRGVAARPRDAESLQRLIDWTPLRRTGKPIEVAYGVLFLASDEASFITGTELVIDGGFIAQ